jgi:hypothetical protein
MWFQVHFFSRSGLMQNKKMAETTGADAAVGVVKGAFVAIQLLKIQIESFKILPEELENAATILDAISQAVDFVKSNTMIKESELLIMLKPIDNVFREQLTTVRI